MAQIFVQQGDVIPVVAGGGGIAAGSTQVVGTLVGIALNTAASGATADVMLEGVFTVAKTTGQAWAQGALLYWDSGTSKFTTTVGSNTLSGTAFVAALSADTTGQIRLKQ